MTDRKITKGLSESVWRPVLRKVALPVVCERSQVEEDSYLQCSSLWNGRQHHKSPRVLEVRWTDPSIPLQILETQNASLNVESSSNDKAVNPTDWGEKKVSQTFEEEGKW